jgi:hypothetical protein
MKTRIQNNKPQAKARQDQGRTPLAQIESRMYIEGKFELENAVQASNALLQLLFHNLDHENSSIFRNDNGYLAAGVQTLMRQTQKSLLSAAERLHISFDR